MPDNDLQAHAGVQTQRSLAGLLDDLELRGVQLRLEDGRLRVDGWPLVHPDERDRLRTERAAVVALLTATAEPEAAKGGHPPSGETEPEPAPEPESGAGTGPRLPAAPETETGGGAPPSLQTAPEPEPSKANLTRLPAARPNVRDFAPGRGVEHFVDRYLTDVPAEDMTPAEAVAARRVFFDRINRGPRGRFADLLAQSRNRW